MQSDLSFYLDSLMLMLLLLLLLQGASVWAPPWIFPF